MLSSRVAIQPRWLSMTLCCEDILRTCFNVAVAMLCVLHSPHHARSQLSGGPSTATAKTVRCTIYVNSNIHQTYTTHTQTATHAYSIVKLPRTIMVKYGPANVSHTKNNERKKKKTSTEEMMYNAIRIACLTHK